MGQALELMVMLPLVQLRIDVAYWMNLDHRPSILGAGSEREGNEVLKLNNSHRQNSLSRSFIIFQMVLGQPLSRPVRNFPIYHCRFP